jgi:hypothetical protein
MTESIDLQPGRKMSAFGIFNPNDPLFLRVVALGNSLGRFLELAGRVGLLGQKSNIQYVGLRCAVRGLVKSNSEKDLWKYYFVGGGFGPKSIKISKRRLQ